MGVRNVVDHGVGFSHRDPGEEQVSIGIHGGVLGAVCKIDAAAKISDVGAGVGSLHGGGVEVVMFAEGGEPGGADGLTFLLVASVPEGQYFDFGEFVSAFGAFDFDG